ncbi:MYND-type domain-containing protein [Favolaschia claudopus]|uniref:MYND-type domain-containing protein n=1 Tax=Favolaschia claudopus TaxID=2862362 RepID=A0AAV9ZJ72_9AGAR
MLAARGSMPAWEQILKLIETSPGPSSYIYLPVIYANLDPTRIPHTDPSSRLWSWIQFLEGFPEHLPERTNPTMPLSVAIWPFLRSPEARTIVHATPSIHAFVIRLWKLLPDSQVRTSPYYGVFYTFLCHCDAPSCVDAFIHACDDNPHTLASLIVQQINLVVGACVDPKAEYPLLILKARLDCLSGLVMIRNPRLLSALLSAGLIKAFTLAIVRLHVFRGVEATLEAIVLMLPHLLQMDTGFPYLPDALKAGLLAGLIGCAAQYNSTSKIVRFVLDIFSTVLPASLAHYRVISALSFPLRRARKSACDPRFLASPVADKWSDFLALAEQRLSLYEHFRSTGAGGFQSCSNYECTELRKVSELKCCGGCQVKLYCSRKCQISDWKVYGHRQLCESIAASTSLTRLHRRQDAFLQLMMRSDHESCELEILRQQLRYMLHYEGRQDFLTEFDYTEGFFKIRVKRAQAAERRQDSQHEGKDGNRAEDEDEQPPVHCVVIDEGSGTLNRSYMVRESHMDSNSMEGLRKIWGDIKSGRLDMRDEEGIMARIRDLIELKAEPF